MTTMNLVTELLCRVHDEKLGARKHSQAKLYPNEVVTLGLLLALIRVGTQPFYRCLKGDCLPLFPNLPERTRLLRLCKSHSHWIESFTAVLTLLGLTNAYDIVLIHPRRDGQSPKQIGRKGYSDMR